MGRPRDSSRLSTDKCTFKQETELQADRDWKIGRNAKKKIRTLDRSINLADAI